MHLKNKEHEIIEVALQLFSEKGYTSTSVDEIAKESGIAKASFYKFFQSKEDVLVATVVMHGHKIDDAICKMYSDTHLPPEQKIAEFVRIYLQNSLDTKFHSMMISMHDKSLFHSEKLIEAFLIVEYKLSKWTTDCLVDIYGEQVEPFAYDVIFMIRGMMMQYLILPMMGLKPNTTDEEFAALLANTVDLWIKGMMEYNYVPIWDWKQLKVDPEHIKDSPIFKGIMIHDALLDLKRLLHHLQVSDEQKEEYRQVLQELEQEILSDIKRKGMLKAMFSFLSQEPTLVEKCHLLQSVLDI